MKCRHCGMDSNTGDVCEWCHKSIMVGQVQDRTTEMAPGSQPTLQMQPQTIKRMALTGEVIETTQELAPMSAVGGYPVTSGTGVGMRASEVASVLPAGAYSPATVQELYRRVDESPGLRWEKFLALALPILALSMLVVYFMPGGIWLIAITDLFFIGLAMGVTQVIPSFDDAFLDCSVMLIVAMSFGPLIALVACVAVGLIKQDVNWAMVALLLLNLVVTKLLGFAFSSKVDTLSMLAMWGLFNWFGFIGVCVSFFGWLCSSFFRRLDV